MSQPPSSSQESASNPATCHLPDVHPDGQSVSEHAASIRQGRVDKLAMWEAAGQNPYPYRFIKSHTNAELQTCYASLENGVETTDEVSVAGRIMALRNSGMFIDLQDPSGKIQVFCHKENLSPEMLAAVKLLDIGDIIGAVGSIRRTPRGELSVKCQTLQILGKSLLPLPEKHHGLTDLETRYRQPYLSLIVNADSRERLLKRSQIISELRSLLASKHFVEVETPMLQSMAGGAAAKPFKTHHNTLDMDMFLRIAPELYLKRLIVGGLSERVFELNRNFRNEGISPRHNPEFTMMELYQAYADYNDMMDLTEEIVVTLAKKVLGTTTLLFQEAEINLAAPWQRKSMTQAVLEETGVDFSAIKTDEQARAKAKEIGVFVEAYDSWGYVLEKVFEDRVEANLIQPIHITDYPREISPLAKTHRHDARLVERFETRVYGWEIANAFSELSDPLDQRKRFEGQVAQRQSGNDEAHQLDEDYITALEYGMPPCGGLGIGIDRLIMILTNASNIRDVIAFPTLKPKH
jgi:lysyl-tRNA synthetase, class II